MNSNQTNAVILKSSLTRRLARLAGRSFQPLLAALVLCALALVPPAAHATTYYSPTSGTAVDPTATANWWTGTGGTGSHPANFTSGDTFVIQNNCTNQVPDTTTWTVNGTANGTATVQINSGGTLRLGAASGTSGTLLLSGNFVKNGTLLSTTGFNSGGVIKFTSDSGTSFTWTGSGDISGDKINVTVNAGVTLDASSMSSEFKFNGGTTTGITVSGTLKMGTVLINGNASSGGHKGFFTVNSGGTLITAHTGGFGTVTATTANGTLYNFYNNSTGLVTLNTAANYTFNGTSAQVPSTSLPATVNNLEINNSAGVTLSQSTTVNGTLTLTSGALKHSTFTLTLGSSANIVVNKTGSSTVGSLDAVPTFGTSVDVDYTGSSAITVGSELPTTSSVLNNLTEDNSVSVALNAARDFKGTLTVNAGTLTVSANQTGTGAVVVNSPGTLTMSSLATLPSGCNMTANTGGTWNLNGTSQTVGTLNGGGTITETYAHAGTDTLTVGGGGTFSGSIAGGNGSTLQAIALTLNASGNTLTLSGANSYQGATTISAGTLALSSGGTLANTPNITVASGAGLNVSAPTTALTLGSGQTLKASATGANTTGTITVGSSKNLTLGGTTTALQFTAYGGGSTAPLTLAGTGGNLDLNSKPVTVTTSSQLAAGTYKLIAKGGSATVTGMPGTLTVNGSGVVSGATPTLQVVSGELYLYVPGISTSGSLTALTTTYGTASSSSSVSVSGTGLTASITATRPNSNFEVSSDNSTWGSTATFTQSGGTASGTLYVRLAATAPVSGSYNSQNTVLSTTGANNVNVATAASGNAVSKATATVTVTPYAVTYDCNPHTATVVSTNGVNGETGATVGLVTLSGTTHTAAGSYPTDSWSLTGGANYNDISSTTISNNIGKATASVTVTPYAVTYDGSAHTATVAVISGVNGETNATVGTVSLSTTHTNVGTYSSDSWSFTGTANYNDIGSTAITDTISQTNLIITANHQNKAYGTTQSTPVTGSSAFTPAGLQNGETVGSVTLTYGAGGIAATDAAGSTSTITPSAATGGTFDINNYNLTYNPGTLTVVQASTSVGATSTNNPSGFKDAVAFLATLPADATGSVVFSSTNGPISTNSISSGSVSSLSITNLPRGTNVITVAYLGDGNYLGSSTNLDQIVTNHPPMLAPLNLTRTAGLDLHFPWSQLTNQWSDADGDAVNLTTFNLSTTNSVTLLTNDTVVLYPSTGPNVVDQINYTASDSYGDTVAGVINIAVNAYVTGTNSIVNITTGNPTTLKAYGVIGFSYITERSTNLTDWASIATNAVSTNGVISVSDSFSDLGGNPPSSAYYRIKWQP